MLYSLHLPDPYLIVSLQGGYYVMCVAMVGCVVCEGYAFFIKNARLLNFIFVFSIQLKVNVQ